jgi:hypothetical protein
MVNFICLIVRNDDQFRKFLAGIETESYDFPYCTVFDRLAVARYQQDVFFYMKEYVDTSLLPPTANGCGNWRFLWLCQSTCMNSTLVCKMKVALSVMCIHVLSLCGEIITPFETQIKTETSPFFETSKLITVSNILSNPVITTPAYATPRV